jgi:hypothetical protein
MTSHELIDNLRTWIENGDDEHAMANIDGIADEPYEGAGYCSCSWCQREYPTLRAALELAESTRSADSGLLERESK